MKSVSIVLIPLVAGLAMATPASAQDGNAEGKRTRIAIGPQVVPSWPGSDDVSFRPFFDIDTATGEQPFEFEAPDEGFGFGLVKTGGLSFGPSLGFEGERKSEAVGGILPKVKLSVELGAFANYEISDNLRLRAEVRQAVSGHDGLIANLGADYIIRDADDYLFSIGPRVTITDNKFQDSYYSVTPAQSIASGLPAYDAGGGVQSVGATAGFIKQLSERWGIYTYAKYERLVGDPADSPVIAAYGSKDQFYGGLAVTYTFDGGIF